MITLHFNNTISERDMDLFFAESILTDPGFCRLLIDKTDMKGKPFQILGAELSKEDSDLGESDITVVVDVDGVKCGLLIEDKIDAIAMPEQHRRYVKRDEKGVRQMNTRTSESSCSALKSTTTVMARAGLLLCLVLILACAVMIPDGRSDGLQQTNAGEPNTGTAAAEADSQPLMLRDLVGVWEFESASFLGRSVTAEELIGSTGGSITMEFTAEGFWILQIGGRNMIAELAVGDDGVVEAPEDQSFTLENGKLLFTVNGMTMVFTRSDAPGEEPSAAPDEAKLGTWCFEQVVYTGGGQPLSIPLGADMFPMVYGVPAPTLQVRKTGLVTMTLGDATVPFTAEEWQLEDGKLTHIETFDDGTSMIWYFVREEAEAKAPTEEAQPETAEAVSAVGGTPVETAQRSGRFTYHGASWGMTKDEVRALEEDEPFQEPTSGSGHSALVYRVGTPDAFRIIQYSFLPSGALYSITIMAPDASGNYYVQQREILTAQYGEPLTEAGADLHSDDDPVAVMMAALMQNSGDTDFLGWRADDETVIIMSMEPVNKVCYVEIRRYTDCFRFQ